MQKKSAVALAVGAMFAAPAMAQTTGSTIEIYGRLYPQVTSAEAKGATDPTGDEKRRLSVDTQNSRIGFRGQEALGGGMAAIWQLESRVRFDTGAGNVWAGNRDSFLGLRSNFGTVKFGNFDTVYKNYGAAVGNFFGVSSGNFVSSSNVLSELGFAPDGGEDGVGRAGQGNATGVKYEGGPLYASLQFEQHNDWFDLSTNVLSVAGLSTTLGTLDESKDTAIRASGKFAITPQHRLTGDVSQLKWKENGPGGNFEYKRVTWAVGWEAKWGGPWATELTYTKADKGTFSGTLAGTGVTGDTTGLDGNQVAAGVAYSFSKRTLVYGIYSKLTNGENAAFNGTANLTVNNGADTTQYAIGMSHSF